MGREHHCSSLAGADADRLGEFEDEDLPVPGLSCLGVLEDCVDRLVDVAVIDGDLQLQLRPKEHRGLRTAVGLCEPGLAARIP